jgi:PAS domain S-box-containing protein
LLRSVLNAVAEALIVTDGRGLVWLFSAAAERMFGYTAAEVIGQNVSMLMPASGRLPHAGHLALTDEWHAIGAPRLVTGQRKNGSMFAVELTVGEAAVHGERLFTGALRELTQPEDRRAASSRRPARKSVRRRVE